MTASGDFLSPEDERNLEVGPTYPTAFGIEFNPKAQAIGLAVLGLLGAFALYNFLVKPVQEQKQTLESEVAQKQAQVDQQRASLQGMAELQAQLDAALQQRVGVYGLLGDSQSLDTLLLDINQQIQNSNATISDVLRADFDRIDQGQLAALGLNQAQVQQIRTEFAGDPITQRLLYTSELGQFSPSEPTPFTDGPPELADKLNRQTVEVSMQALFPQTLSILRNIERLEPLIIIRDLQQEIASPPAGASEEQLAGVTRLLDTSFTLEVLVPAIDPATPPPPPPPPEPTEGEAPPPEGG
jgi:type IV pilus assembly protein PilO